MVTRKRKTNNKTRAATEVYLSRLVVKIDSPIPFDMFRHDACIPDTKRDSEKLARIALGTATTDDLIVTLRRYWPNANGPDYARWIGFGARVIEWEPLP